VEACDFVQLLELICIKIRLMLVVKMILLVGGDAARNQVTLSGCIQ